MVFMSVDSTFLLVTVVGLSVLSAIGTLLYRFFFHPLAHFPGPKLAIATYGYEWYYDLILGGQYTFKLKELHERYGSSGRSCQGAEY